MSDLKTDPAVSVILCTHNGSERIAKAISSVLSQLLPVLELIVIDDCSVDGTGEIVGSFVDPRIVYERLPQNAGPYVARNRGLDLAKGQFIAFIDDDDEWLPEKLARQMILFREQPQIGLVHCGTTDVMPDGRELRRLPPRWADDYRSNIVADGIITSSVVVRSSVFNRVSGFDANLRSFGDWDKWLDILALFPVGHIPEALIRTSQHSGSIQHSGVELLAASRAYVLQKHAHEALRFGLTTRVEAFHDYFVAAKLLHAGRAAEARTLASTSFRRSPSIRAALVFALSWLHAPHLASTWSALQALRRRLRT